MDYVSVSPHGPYICNNTITEFSKSVKLACLQTTVLPKHTTRSQQYHTTQQYAVINICYSYGCKKTRKLTEKICKLLHIILEVPEISE